MKISPVEAELFRAGRQGDVTKLIVALSQFCEQALNVSRRTTQLTDRLLLTAPQYLRSQTTTGCSFFANNKNRILWNSHELWCDDLLSAQPPLITYSEVPVNPQTRRIYRQTSGVRLLSPQSCSEEGIRCRHMVIKLLRNFVYFRQKITWREIKFHWIYNSDAGCYKESDVISTYLGHKDNNGPLHS